MPHRLIEKKRRDRINLSIGCLKDLLPDDMKTEVSCTERVPRTGSTVLGLTKNDYTQPEKIFKNLFQNARPLEKAVVLELTIKYIRQLQKSLLGHDVKPSPQGKPKVHLVQ